MSKQTSRAKTEDSCNISLDNSLNVERLKTFSSQNFTALLNNPIPEVSLFNLVHIFRRYVFWVLLW